MQPADAIAAVKRVLDAGNSALKAEALGNAATSLASTAAQVLAALPLFLTLTSTVTLTLTQVLNSDST